MYAGWRNLISLYIKKRNVEKCIGKEIETG
jgi:hypothetical protein